MRYVQWQCRYLQSKQHRNNNANTSMDAEIIVLGLINAGLIDQMIS